MSSPEEEIDDYQFKQLLQDVEDTGLPRDEVNFLSICNNDPRLYGRKGSDQRRAFQFKWNYIKKWDIHRYIELLDSKVIGPNVANEALLRQSEPESQRPANTDVKKNRQKNRDVKNNRDDDEEEEEDGGGVEESINDVAARLAGIAMSSDDDDVNAAAADDKDEDDDGVDGQGPEPRWKAAMSTPPRATRPRWSTRTPDHLSSPSLRPRAAYQRDVVSPFPAGESEVTSGGGDGTRKNPYVVKVDPNHPERHFIFDIERVVNMVHNAHEYNGYHVRVSIACPDFEIWEATIPATSLPKKYRDFAKRAIVIKGPARSYWLSNVAMYHSKLTKSGADCPETKRRHTHTALAISKDPPRKDAYWLLLWPKGTVLDNQILSSHATELKKGILGLDVDGSNNPLGKHLYGMAIYWRIVEKYGGSQVEDNAAKVDATTLFD
jgi:hypothetical protein